MSNKKISLYIRIFALVAFTAVFVAENAKAAVSLEYIVGFKPLVDLENPTKIAQEKELPSKEEMAKRIDKYFEKRNMPLSGYGYKFAEVATKCEIDWRLLPAIGVRESSGGKFQFNNNPFGWGSAKIKFKDFGHAIENVSDHLCGFVPTTERYYKDKTTYEKLWYYNGTVIRSYPKEVMDIMDMI